MTYIVKHSIGENWEPGHLLEDHDLQGVDRARLLQLGSIEVHHPEDALLYEELPVDEPKTPNATQVTTISGESGAPSSGQPEHNPAAPEFDPELDKQPHSGKSTPPEPKAKK